MEELIAKYLADELGAQQRADFESKLVQDESFSLEFEAYLNAWDLQDKSPGGSFNAESAWNNMQKQITETPVVEMKKSNFYFLKIAATLLILAVAGYFVIQNNEEAPINRTSLTVKATTNNVTEAFQLPDGSEVRLNASSKISYDEGFGTANRNITLVGQADFDVERNESLPFVITAGNSKVEVLGTSFDVAAYPNKSVKVAVTEGRVEFSSTVNAEEKAVLAKGQQAKIDKEGQNLEVTEIEDDNFKGWWTRELNFEEDPFSEAFEILERTYQVEIEYPEALKDCLWTAQISPDDTIDGIMDVFNDSFQKVTVTKKENGYILEGSVCDK